MKKVKLLVIILILISFIFLLYINSHTNTFFKIYRQIFKRNIKEPINLSTGLINNEYFNINSSGENAEHTTEGINEALEYASKNNIEYVKFEKGTYLIKGIGENYIAKGIIVPSNITLDLNGSIFRHKDNNSERYTVFSIYEVENVNIINGIIYGDKDTHDYSTNSSIHEWGYGIDIRGSKNISIKNLQLSKLTGDAIIVCELPPRYSSTKSKILSDEIEISNNNIYDCRRQGISVISGINIKIHDNEIHDIVGTNPQAAIDLESNEDYETIDNVEIYRNKLYKLGDTIAILTYPTTDNLKIYENEINGIVLINAIKNKVIINNNAIKDGRIIATSTYEDYNSIKGVNKVVISENTLKNSNVAIQLAVASVIENNKFIDSYMKTYSSDVAVYNNEFSSNLSKIDYAILFYNVDKDPSTHTVYINDNNITGNYKQEILYDSEKVIINTEKDKLEEFIKNIL